MADPLGDRVKAYESVESARTLMPKLPVIARIDGRAFHTFTRGMQRPFDYALTSLMRETTRRLVEETQACLGYTQSDEISLTWHSTSLESQIFFNGRVQKMTSVLAGLATAIFNWELPRHLDRELRSKLPHFDCRVFNVPTREDAVDVFLWREADAVRNSIQMAAQAKYPYKVLQNKNCSELQEMLHKVGINWNDYPTYFKRGSYAQKVHVMRTYTPSELTKLPPLHEAHKNPALQVCRSEVQFLGMPILATVQNPEEVIYEGADPITIKENL